MTGGEPLPVAFTVERSYVPWVAAAIRSYLDHNPDDGSQVHVLHQGLDADQERGLDELAPGRIVVHRVDPDAVADLPAVGRFGTVVWLRFLLPALLPEVPRILYLDADVLVTGSTHPLWSADLRGCALAAVPNVVGADMRGHVEALGLAPGAPFLNSGVLLMDLDRWRADGATARLAGYVRDAEHLVWPDQDALNVIFDGAWHRLHPRWNAQNTLWFWPQEAAEVFGAEALAEATSTPAIVHFEGPSLAKPWHVLCQHPYRDAWRAALARTPWAATPRTGDDVATRLIRLLPSRWQASTYARLVRSRAEP